MLPILEYACRQEMSERSAATQQFLFEVAMRAFHCCWLEATCVTRDGLTSKLTPARLLAC